MAEIINGKSELDNLIQDYKKQNWFEKNAMVIAPIITLITLGIMISETRFFRPIPGVLLMYFIVDVLFIIATTFLIRMFTKTWKKDAVLLRAIKKIKNHPKQELLKKISKAIKTSRFWAGFLTIIMSVIIFSYGWMMLKILVLIPFVVFGILIWIIFYMTKRQSAINELANI